MERLIRYAAGALLVFALTHTASAQGLEQKCLDSISGICGGADADICFEKEHNWQLLDPACEGDAQTLVEMAREAKGEQGGQSSEGASLGGKVRSGPGTNHDQVGSLAEGDLVTLEENTGVMMNGYPWFKVIHIDNMTGFSLSGYQWGGILCAFDEMPGVFQRCPVNWSDNPDRLQESRNNAGEDPIAPVHGNSDEDNEEIAASVDATIAACLQTKSDAGQTGLACIGAFSDSCIGMEQNQTTAGMRHCISLEHAAWDKMLNSNYKEMIASLDTDSKRSSLRDAQRLWNQFVVRFCPLGYEFHAGSMFLVTGDQCILEMTAHQALNLRRLSAN